MPFRTEDIQKSEETQSVQSALGLRHVASNWICLTATTMVIGIFDDGPFRSTHMRKPAKQVAKFLPPLANQMNPIQRDLLVL